MEWKKFEDELPFGSEGTIMCFPVIADAGHSYMLCSPAYAKAHQVRHKFTHWTYIDPPSLALYADVVRRCEAGSLF